MQVGDDVCDGVLYYITLYYIMPAYLISGAGVHVGVRTHATPHLHDIYSGESLDLGGIGEWGRR